MDDFDYDEDDYSESEIDEIEDFYSTPKPIAPSSTDLNPEPFLRPNEVETIDRKSNYFISVVMVVLFVGVLAFVIDMIAK